MGKTTTADPSAIVAGFWSRELKKLHIEYESRKVRGASLLLKDIIKVQKEFGCLVWGFKTITPLTICEATLKSAAWTKAWRCHYAGLHPSSARKNGSQH
jgi:hypothetical protein